MKKRIAVLLTCFNRHIKTIKCLESVYSQSGISNTILDIFLVDDNSPDNTGKIIKEQFPEVNVLNGDGSLYWVGGMRMAWKEALKHQYDGYLLLNDDVILETDTIKKLLDTNQYCLQKFNEGGVYIGSTIDAETNKISYGGRKILNKLSGKSILAEPHQTDPVECDFAHANILLVMKNVVQKLGILSEKFTQSLADYDYTLKVKRNGFHLLVCPGYCGVCKDDHGKNWLTAEHDLKERIDYLKNPKHLAYDEYLYFMKWHYPYYMPISFVKLWAKTLFPSIWDKLKS